MLTAESLRFDLADFELREDGVMRRGWINPDGVGQSVQFGSGAIDWPFDLTRLDEAREFYRGQCQANGGAMLAAEVVPIAGFEALGGVFKYRSPEPSSLAMYYVAILWLPFRECWFQVNIEALERGATGVREALVMMLHPESWPEAQGEPTMLPAGVDFATHARRTPVRPLPSDEPRHDEKFPAHPLSLVRRRLGEVIATAHFEPAVARNLRPFRLGRRPWWRGGRG